MFDAQINSNDLLDRICQVYDFKQKIQLARHFDITASALNARYTRGTISYDLAAACSIETGANLQWLLTGDGPQFNTEILPSTFRELSLFDLKNDSLVESGNLVTDKTLFPYSPAQSMCVRFNGQFHFIDKESTLSDGLCLLNIDGAICIREITKMPGKKALITGGKIPFECSIDDITIVGRVVGIYSEVN